MAKDYEAIFAAYQARIDATFRKMEEEGVQGLPYPLTRKEEEERQEAAAMIKINKIRGLLQNGEQQEAADLIDLSGNTGKWRSAYLLHLFYKDFTDEAILFRLITKVYVNDGYNFPQNSYEKGKAACKKFP